MRRARTYSDPRVIAFISEHFVPAAVNINHLQRQDDEEGRVFRTISWQGRFGKSFDEARSAARDPSTGECHQGQYVASIDGELFGSRHTADPDQLLSMMRDGLAAWENRRTQRESAEVGDVERDARHVWTYTEDGLVLHLGCRDLRDEADAVPEEWTFDAHNQNYAWFTAEEAKSIVQPAIVPGDRFGLPAAVHRRLVRFHLLDIVRGETPPWHREAPDDVAIDLHCADVDGDRVALTLTGGGLLVESGDWCSQPVRRSVYRRGEMCCRISERGFEPEILGYAVYDRAAERFDRFDLVAVGTRWGGTTFNFRQEDVAPARLGIAMTIAGDHARDRTPPASTPARYFDA